MSIDSRRIIEPSLIRWQFERLEGLICRSVDRGDPVGSTASESTTVRRTICKRDCRLPIFNWPIVTLCSTFGGPLMVQSTHMFEWQALMPLDFVY
jgi:hypothetical protein